MFWEQSTSQQPSPPKRSPIWLRWNAPVRPVTDIVTWHWKVTGPTQTYPSKRSIWKKTGPCNSNVKKKWNIHEEMPEHILTPGLVLWRIEIPDHYSGISTERFHFNRFPETLGSSPKMNLTWNWSFSSSPAVSGVGRGLQAD